MTALTVTLSPGKISSSLPYPIDDYDLETLIALVFLLKAKSINLLTGLLSYKRELVGFQAYFQFFAKRF